MKIRKKIKSRKNKIKSNSKYDDLGVRGGHRDMLLFYRKTGMRKLLKLFKRTEVILES